MGTVVVQVTGNDHARADKDMMRAGAGIMNNIFAQRGRTNTGGGVDAAEG